MPLYVTNFVLDECYTLLASEEIEKAAWEVFARFNQAKTWSFTDCTTKVVMDSLGLQLFATNLSPPASERTYPNSRFNCANARSC